jgi:hypothetical protein
MDLTVENMFSQKSYEITRLVGEENLPPTDRKRLTEHVIAQVVSQILSQPGSDPSGLAVTVTGVPGPQEGTTQLLITATSPRYVLSDEFIKDITV